ncbi:MAG: signal recognition particle protein [Holosporales bacterium]|jgi:signal recognition particle subunit SRP54|nr:signal recognition particle protein [Holosporales bacterium]
MFEILSKKLLGIFDGIRNRGILTTEIIDKTIREIRVSLLEADVALSVVKSFTSNLKEKLNGEEIIKSTSPEQTINKYVYDEMVNLLGVNNITVKNGAILMCGLQGSGKTTTSAKLANILQKKHNKGVLLVSLDTTRPAAIDQLRKLAKNNSLEFFENSENSPISIAKQAVKVSKNFDITVFDTAGRMYVDDNLMNELAELKNIITPREIFLVIDSMMGQDALKTAISFNEAINGLSGLIMTRIDGDNRGGACLSAKSVTNCQIRYLGMGEKIDDIEDFYPERIASRIMDNGDIISLVEKVMEENVSTEIVKSKEFNMNDMEKHLKQLEKLGGIGGFLKFIPGMGRMKDMLKESAIDNDFIKNQVAIIRSMTKRERTTPRILNASRRRRIAAGCGKPVSEVNKLIKQFEGLKNMMSKMEKGNGNPRSIMNILGK